MWVKNIPIVKWLIWPLRSISHDLSALFMPLGVTLITLALIRSHNHHLVRINVTSFNFKIPPFYTDEVFQNLKIRNNLIYYFSYFVNYKILNKEFS